MSANSKMRNPEAEGRKFWAVVCVCVAGLLCATLLTIGLNSAKADVADVEFDAVSIKQGAKLAVNGTHILTAGRDNQLLAEETSDEEVLSEQTDDVLASFAEEKYQQDPVVQILTNAGYPTRAYISENFAYISNPSLSYWLQDTRSFHGVSTRSWRTTDNKASVVKVPMNGKAPDGTLFTSADGTTVDTKDYDFETDTTFADYNVKAGEWVHSIYSSSSAEFYWRAASSVVIEDGQDAWNNPYLIDDTDQGYYKTRVWGVSTHPMYGYPINGKVVYEKGADGSDNALIVKAEKGLTYKKGDILVAFAMPNSSVGLRLENKAEGFNSSSEYGLVAFYYKAKSSGTIGARVVSNDQIFSGVYHFSEDTTVKGSFFSAGQHAVRPLYQLKMSKIAFLRPTDSGVDVDISSTLGNLPTRFLFGDSSKKLVVKSENVTIDATITTENVTSDRDTGRAKCTKVEGTTVKVPWASKTVTIDNVSTNNANYVSALVHTEDGKKYGVLAKSEEGKVTLDLENLVNTTLLGSKATVSLYAEQASDANYSDSISAKPVTFQIEIAAVAPQTLVYDTDGGKGETPASSFAGAGETVQLANGDDLTKEGMSFSRWKLSYVPYGATEAVSLTYKSGENLVVPDTADGVISVKAVYAGIDLEKTTSSSGSVFTVTWYANSPANGVDTRVGTERKLNTKIDKVAGVGTLTADNIPADAVNVTEGSKWGFAGWGLMPNVSPANAMSKEDLAGTIVTQNVQYYAIWELKSTINWDANGGYFGTTDKTTTQTLADPDEGTLIDASNMPTTSPKNSDTTKIFTGYNTLADGTGTSVYAGGPEVLAEEGSTFYATWTTIDTYWMAPSYANGKETEGIVKGPDTIQADVAILRNGATDSRYAQVKAEWDGFLNNNSYSLYTKWNGSTEDEAGEQALNGWAEFHLLEVATDKDGVGASMSFMSSYAIPYAMPAFSSSSYYGYSTDIWKNHLVCPKLQQGGEIFESYGARLRNDILTVTKSKVENKMWLMSVYDTNFTWWQNASNITDVTYIMYKTRAQNLPKGFDTSRIYSNMIWCFYLRDNFPNRNDSQKLNYYCGMGRYSQYYDYGLKWHYEIAQGPSQKYASILPCFCF